MLNIMTKNEDLMAKKQTRHELYISKFAPITTEEDVRNFLEEMGITELNGVEIIKLVKKEADISTLSFVSFKLVTNETIANTLMNEIQWPNNCTVKKFISKHKKASTGETIKSSGPPSLSISDFLRLKRGIQQKI